MQATAARWSAEVAITKTMLARTETCFGLKPQRIAADAAYGSGLMIGWFMRREITPHIPIIDHEHQTSSTFTRADFTYDAKQNVFTCPGGKLLKSSGLVRDDGTVPYWASTKDCGGCALRPSCTTGPSDRDTQPVRGGARASAGADGNRSLPAVGARTEESRDAVRPFENPPGPATAQAPRIEWSLRRIPARRHGPESQEACPLRRNHAAKGGSGVNAEAPA